MATKYLYKTAQGYVLTSNLSYAAIPDPSIYANDTFIPFPTTASFQDVSVLTTSFNTWDVSSGAATWITFLQKANQEGLGNGWGGFRASVPQNDSGNRTGIIKVISKYSGNWTIDVSQNAAAADTVSCSPTSLEFTTLGKAKITTVTSSGTWTTSVVSDVDSIVMSYTASGTTGQNCTIQLNPNVWSNNPLYATLRFTVGIATADLDICQDGISTGCGV